MLHIDKFRFKRAIIDTTKALDKEEKNPNIYFRRGLANYLSFHFKSCIKDMRKALEYNIAQEHFGSIYYHIGISFANIEKYFRAIEPLTLAITNK